MIKGHRGQPEPQVHRENRGLKVILGHRVIQESKARQVRKGSRGQKARKGQKVMMEIHLPLWEYTRPLMN